MSAAQPRPPEVATTTAAPVESSPWAPFGQRAFRLLWPGVLVSYLGVWMQSVGAQWLLVDDAGGTVALVQTAATLPIMLLALPAGVLADAFDRRWLMITVQVYVFVVAGSLAALTAAGLVTAPLMLIFTFLLGVGAAVQLPTWQAILPELVPRPQLGAATRLEMVGVNAGRSIGPAVAGIVIAASSVWVVFALNAASVVVLTVALLRWHRPLPPPTDLERERFLPALRAGGRYVWHEPMVRRILLRVIMIIAPGTVLWALLPVIARERLGLSADGYGALFGAIGIGAVGTVLIIGRIRTRVSTNLLLAGAGLVLALALTALVLVPSFVIALLVLVAAGLAWTSVISTLNAELQLCLPVWVRARGLAVYLMVFTGSQALASVVWGQVSQYAGVRVAFLIAAGVLGVSVLLGLVLRLPQLDHAGAESVDYWGEARVSGDVPPPDGTVMITIEYVVGADRQVDFLAAMHRLARSRRRTGAMSWELYRDGEHPDRFVEVFRVPSWTEHLRQHEGRLTAADQRLEEVALAYSDPPARATHLLPP